MQPTSEPSMPHEATRNLFLVAGGFGLGAIVVLGAFVFLIGIGAIPHDSVSPATPAAQSAAHAPAARGPAPQAAPKTAGKTAGPAVETTGQAPAAAQPDTPRATTPQQPPAAAQPK